MRIRSSKVLALAMVVVGLIQSLPCRAGDDQSDRETSERQQRIKDFMEQSVKSYELSPNAAARTPLTPQVAMRWINASRERDKQDFLLLWVHEGRPLAAASVFPTTRYLCHEFCSLSGNAELV